MKNIWHFLFPLLVFLILPAPNASAKTDDLHSENGFVAAEREDGFLRIIRYEGTLDEDGKLEIPATITDSTGEREVREISSLFATNSDIRNAVKEARFPEGLQKLGDTNLSAVFRNCSSLESVYIPSTLETANSPFLGCANLKSVEFGVSLPRVPSTLFNGCTGLTEIRLPSLTTVVEGKAFQGCSSLETVTFHAGAYLTEIQASAFQNCASLKALNLPTGLRTLGEYAFSNCSALEEVFIPVSLTTAGSATKPAFSGCSSLNNVRFQDGLTSIIANLFAKCDGLKRIEIPRTVVSIGSGAFAESGLTSVEIPDSVTSYGTKAFQNCAALTRARLSSMAPIISEQMFYKCYALESLYADPATITTINKEGFSECKRLTELPAWTALNAIGNSAFYRCEALASIALPESLTSLGERAFQNDLALNTVVIPSMITVIPKYAFAQCYALTDIVIPKSVKSIADYAFYQDTSLLRVFIPASVTSISNKEAFSYIDQMTVEGVPGSYAEDWASRNGAREFVDKSVPIQTISLAGGGQSMILPRSCVVAPVFDVTPAENTDTLTLTSSNSSVAVRNGYILYCTKALTTPVTVTATATSGLSFDFTVTCEDLTGLEVSSPEIVNYVTGDSMDWTGFAPQAVFKSGARQPIYNYPPSADTIRDKVLAWSADGFDSKTTGSKTVTVSYDKFSATFEAGVFASASELPVTLRRVERVTDGVRVWTHGSAGNAKFCSVVSFDADGLCLGVAFKALSDADTAAGFADFSALPGTASVKAVLLNDDALTPSCCSRTLAVA